jgi:hypothetical protein
VCSGERGELLRRRKGLLRKVGGTTSLDVVTISTQERRGGGGGGGLSLTGVLLSGLSCVVVVWNRWKDSGGSRVILIDSELEVTVGLPCEPLVPLVEG